MTKIWAIAALAACMIAGPALSAADPQLGQWNLNVAKSKYVSAKPPRSSVATVVPYGDNGLSVSVDMINAAGQPAHIRYSARFDGKPYPRTETGAGGVPGQTVILKRIDSRTVERTVWLGKKPGGTERWVISADGKTRSVTQSGVDLNGKPIDNVQLYEKPSS